MRAAFFGLLGTSLLAACQPYPPLNVPYRGASSMPVVAQPEPQSPECDAWLASGVKDVAIVPLFSKIKAAVKPKSEFETKTAFDARAAEALAKIASVFPAAAGGNLVVTRTMHPGSISYDAETQKMKLLGAGSSPYSGFVTSEMAYIDNDLLPVIESDAAAGSYVGSNAFGALAQVRVYRGQEYGVMLMEAPQGKTWAARNGVVTLSADPDRAKGLKSKLGVRVVGKLVPPGAMEGIGGDSPTISRPVDRTTSKRYVTIETLCAAVVATDTGEVILRLR